MRVKGLERIEDIILAMDDLINKKNKTTNFIEKKYIKSDGNILSSEYDLYREEKENLEKNFKEKMDELLNILDNICKRVRKKQAALGELSENNLNIGFYIPRKIAFGKRKIQYFDSVTKQKLMNDIYVPKLLEFPFKKNMFITGDEQIELLHQVYLRLLYALPIGKIEFYVFDPYGLGKAVESFNSLFPNEKIFPNKKIIIEKKELKATLDKLLAYTSELRHNKFNSEQKNWEEYNRFLYSKGEYNKILPYKIFTFMNVPDEMGEEEFNAYRKLLRNSEDCGILIISSFNETILEGEDTRRQGKALELKKCIEESYPLDDLLNSKTDKIETQNFVIKNISEKTPERQKIQEKINIFLKVLEEKKNRLDNLSIFLDENNRFNRKSQIECQIPIGFDSKTNEVIEIKVGDNPVHYLIGGGTGSGKSTFLHSFILSACNRYSPNELKLYMLDFKEAVEFNVYANPVILPHIALVATDADISYGLSVLKHMSFLIKNRNKKFKLNGCKDINSYREKTKEDMPRIFLIMDEFQILFQSDLRDEVSEEMLIIAKQGRSCGIHMILSTQSLKGLDGFGNIASQIGGRIILKSSAEDSKSLFGASDNNEEAAKIDKPYAILNVNSGYKEYNQKFIVPWHENKVEEKIANIKRFVEAKGLKIKNKIFDGSKNPSFPTENFFFNEGDLTLKLGKILDYNSKDFEIKFENEKDNNLLIIGIDKKIKRNLMNAILLSIENNKDYKYIYIGKNRVNIDLENKNSLLKVFNNIEPEAINNSNVVELLELLKSNESKKAIIIDEINLTFFKQYGLKGKDKELKELFDNMSYEGNIIISFYSKSKEATENHIMDISRNIIAYNINEEERRKLTETKINTKDLLYIVNREVKVIFKNYAEKEIEEEVEDEE